ncbi:MAG: toll/interleukin-1 receptor domain-containing protein [Planctomycetota bacterium]|nr:MAG: toll/interleukin-1 receptor domain-containing protein [Planctomycetota bacterium]
MSEFPYDGAEPYVYVSYAREDEDKCRRFIDHLNALGYRVHFNDDIEVDQDKVRQATNVVFLVTAGAGDSEEVKLELQYASAAAKDGVAIYIEECSIDGTVGLLLGQFDELKRYRMKEAFFRKRLQKSLDASTQRPGAVPPPVVEMEFAAPTPKPLPKIEAPPAPTPKAPPQDELAAQVAAFQSQQGGASGAPARKPTSASRGVEAPAAVQQAAQRLQENPKLLYGILGGAGALLLVGLIALAIVSPSGGPEGGSGEAAAGAEGEDAGPALTPEEREAQRRALQAELEKRQAERERLRKERERREAIAKALGDGRRLLRERQYDQALGALTRALELDPKNVEAYLLRAEAFYRLKNDAQAVADYQKVLALDAKNLAALVGRGKILRYKEPKKAVADLTAALKLDPKNVEAWILRGDAKRQVGSKKWLRSAIKDYSYSIKLDPRPAAYYGRSLCYKKLGDQRRADRDLEAARRQKP